jgi:hypothetical protein
MLSLLAALILILAAFLIFRSVTDYRGASSPQAPELEKLETTSEERQTPQFEKWREFSATDGDFRVLLPSLPQHVKDKFEDPLTKEPRKYDVFVTTESEQPVFMIGAITFPRELKKGEETEKTLRAIIDQIASKNPHNKLQSVAMKEFRAFPAIDFTIDNGDATMGGKAFMFKNILYILTMANNKKAFNQSELDFFINSFQVITKKSAETNAKK